MCSMISVLYVDDEPGLLDLGKTYLEMTGEFIVDLQISAPAAFAMLKARQFDAIVSDYQMPEMDGLEFLKQVRNEFGQIPFILFTGRGREEVVIRALNNGADFYLQKGGEPESQFTELAHKIRQAVQRRKTELALEKSEQRYRDVVETQTEFICRFRPDGTHVFVNEAYCRYFNKTREEIIDHRFIPKVPDVDSGRIQAHFRSLTSAHPSAEMEHRVIMPDSSIRWHWWSDRAIFDEAGSLQEYQSVGKDITDRKIAEEALAESNSRLKNLGENLPGVIFQFELTADGKFRFPYISGRWSEIFDLTTHEATKIPDLVVAKIFPEDLEKMNNLIVHSAAVMEPWQMEFRANIRGRTMWIFGRSIPEKRRPDGSILWNGVLIDITERKEAETALRESEEKFRVLAETIPVAICVFQGDHDVYVNDYTAQVTGYTKEELCTMNFWDAIHPESRELLRSRGLARLRGEDVPSQYEIKYLTKAGETRWADISVGRIQFGGTMAGLATLVDITDRKRTEEALKTSEKDYRSIIENIQDAFYRADEQGNLTLISPSFAHRFGYSDVREVLGKNIRETFYFAPSERDDFLSRIKKYGKIEEFQLSLKTRDGTPMIVSASSHIYYTEDGKFGGVEGILHDITDRVKAEAALVNSEADHLKILDSIPHILFEMDNNFRITSANRGAQQTLANPPGGLLEGTDAFTFIDPAQHDRMRVFLKGFPLKEGPIPAGEFTIIRSNGIMFPALIILDRIMRNQKFSGFRGIVIDISEQKKIELALHESQVKFNTLVDRSLDGIIIVDMTGRLLFANRKMGEIAGFDPATDLVGTACIFDFILPEFVRKARYEFSLVVDELDSYLTNYKIRTLVGKELWIECIGRKISFEGTDAILLSVRDVTTRKTMDEILRENEKLYRNIADSLPDYLLVHRGGTILYANKATLDILKIASTDIIGRSIFDFVTGESRQVIETNIIPQDIPDICKRYEVDAVIHNGEIRRGLIHSTITSFGGEPAHLLVITDITSLQQIQQALEKVNAKLNMLSSITRHDLLNKLTGLEGYLCLALEVGLTHPDARNYLEKAKDTAAVMRDQVQFTWFYQEIGVKKPEWILLDGAVRTAAQQLPHNDVRLTVCTGSLEVYADPLIEKVFYNLLENSLRHGGHVRSISVSAGQSEEGVVVEYHDDGTGIPPDEKELIFGRGFGKNSGFGLFFIREALSITGITISETGTFGKGATFRLVVPKGGFRSGDDNNKLE